MFRISLFFCLLLAAFTLQGQKFPEHREKIASNQGSAFLVHLLGGFALPGADLADRFGSNGMMGVGAEFISTDNWIIGGEGQFYFGNEVKEDPLAILRTPEGDIIGNDRLVASVVLRQRGLYLGGHVGRLFPVGKGRSGIRITLGAGVQRHWLRIQDDNRSVTQLTGDYKKGYDRMSGGPTLNQFVGWQHLSADRRSNFMLGFEFSQGFTQSLRDWDFNEMRKLDGRRNDLRFGLKAAWTLPFYTKGAEQLYY